MAYLLDTGILLRLVDTQDSLHQPIRQAIETLAGRRADLFTTTQNVAEFWNVATRPVDANGLGLPVSDVVRVLEHIIEPTCGLLVEHDALYEQLKRLGSKYGVSGKQIHDARLVAMMLSWQIDKVLTLNDQDFRRYEGEGIAIVTPQSLPADD